MARKSGNHRSVTRDSAGFKLSMDVDQASARWQKLGLPDVPGFELMLSVFRVHQVMVSEINDCLQGFDLGLRRYVVLQTLALSDSHVLSMSQLSSDMMVHPTTVTGLVDQLEKAQLVKRDPHPADRRSVLVVLTPAGRRLALRAGRALAEIGFGVEGLSEVATKRLVAGLRDVRPVGGVPGPAVESEAL